MMLCVKFGWNRPSGSGGEVENVTILQADRQTDRRMDGCRTKLTWVFSSGEPKMRNSEKYQIFRMSIIILFKRSIIFLIQFPLSQITTWKAKDLFLIYMIFRNLYHTCHCLCKAKRTNSGEKKYRSIIHISVYLLVYIYTVVMWNKCTNMHLCITQLRQLKNSIIKCLSPTWWI